jgi:hypothetical protein
MVCIVFSAVQPALLIFVPFGLLALALPPHRPVTVAAGALLLTSALVGMRPEGQAAIGRAWALLAGGWFLLAVVLLPRQHFVMRGLVAVGGAVATVVALLAGRGDALQRVDTAFAERLRGTATAVADAWISRNPGRFGTEFGKAIQRAAEVQVTLYPALLALATMAGLAVAWWAWGRLTMRPEGSLAPLREFRFSDGLVWLLIVGLVLALLPRAPEAAARAGSNLLAFMAALYALRGAAVLLFVAGMPGPLGLLLATLAVVVLYPLVMAATFLIGLFDTWLDIRKKRPVSAGPEA